MDRSGDHECLAEEVDVKEDAPSPQPPAQLAGLAIWSVQEGEFLRLFRSLVSRSRRRFGIQQADAEDIAQDALMKLMQKQRGDWERLSRPAGLAVFLLGDAHSLFYRRRRRGGNDELAATEGLQEVAERVSAPRLVDEAVVLGVLLEAVPELPPPVVALVHEWLGGNWGLNGCARALGVSRRTVFVLRKQLWDFLHSRVRS